MSISYSGLRTYGKSTLPSVSSWGDNAGILRDPPRSITTRKIDKVGETMSIVSMIDEATDRACENINVYARGTNPMVAVQFNNQGGGKQAYLPYRVARDGAFRPPIMTQEDLLPLSRLPRIWTSNFSNPNFTDFSKIDFLELDVDVVFICVTTQFHFFYFSNRQREREGARECEETDTKGEKVIFTERERERERDIRHANRIINDGKPRVRSRSDDFSE